MKTNVDGQKSEQRIINHTTNTFAKIAKQMSQPLLFRIAFVLFTIRIALDPFGKCLQEHQMFLAARPTDGPQNYSGAVLWHPPGALMLKLAAPTHAPGHQLAKLYCPQYPVRNDAGYTLQVDALHSCR